VNNGTWVTFTWEDSTTSHEQEQEWPYAHLPEVGNMVSLYAVEHGGEKDVLIYGTVASVWFEVPTDARDPLAVKVSLEDIESE